MRRSFFWKLKVCREQIPRVKDDGIKVMNVDLTPIIRYHTVADWTVTEHIHATPKEPGGVIPPLGPIENCLCWLVDWVSFNSIFILVRWVKHTSHINKHQ